ncbi:MAG TPA: Gfo/Idh/MocA family oxidoreductase, partial [Cytophagaceae bacterium]
MMNKLKIGFIGAGRVADVHYNALQSCSDKAELAAFCELREDALASRALEWNVPGYSSMEAMFAEVALDAVVVLLPHDIHLEVIEKCLKRRLPVLLEKPLAANIE